MAKADKDTREPIEYVKMSASKPEVAIIRRGAPGKRVQWIFYKQNGELIANRVQAIRKPGTSLDSFTGVIDISEINDKRWIFYLYKEGRPVKAWYGSYKQKPTSTDRNNQEGGGDEIECLFNHYYMNDGSYDAGCVGIVIIGPPEPPPSLPPPSLPPPFWVNGQGSPGGSVPGSVGVPAGGNPSSPGMGASHIGLPGNQIYDEDGNPVEQKCENGNGDSDNSADGTCKTGGGGSGQPDKPDEKEPCTPKPEDLKKAFPRASESDLNKIAETIKKYGKDFGIDTSEKLRHFMAQVHAETGGLKKLLISENLYYTTAKRLALVYPSKFSLNKKHPTKLYAGDYLRNPQKLANTVYCCKGGHGGKKSGDGWRYRGRGVFQLTWKANYAEFTKYYNKHFSTKQDFVQNPDLLSTNSEIAALSAMWYFKARVLDRLKGKKLTAENVTKRVNKKRDAPKKRKVIFENIKSNVKCN